MAAMDSKSLLNWAQGVQNTQPAASRKISKPWLYLCMCTDWSDKRGDRA